MLVMFLAIGRRTLELENPSDKNNPLKKFCKAINKLHIPLLPENSQDKWYL